MARQPGGVHLIDAMTRRAARATTIRELRQAQAVLLPLFGLSLEETSLAVGLSVSWVAKQRAEAVRSETLMPLGAHGGRRRALFKSEGQERAYVSALSGGRAEWRLADGELGPEDDIAALFATLDQPTFTVTELQNKLQQALGRPVSRSGALGFGRRHGLIRRRDA